VAETYSFYHFLINIY